MSQRGFTPIIVIVTFPAIALLIMVIGLLKFGPYWKSSQGPFILPSVKPVACTLEAKLCPDGSSVGRTGPNCEFTPCPTQESTSSADISNWKTYTNSNYGAKYTYKYPSNWVIEKAAEGGGDLLFIDSNQKLYMGVGPLQTEISATPENLASKLILQNKEVISKKNIVIDNRSSVFLEIGSKDDGKIYVLVPNVLGTFMSGTSNDSPISTIENVKGTLWITLHIDANKDFTKELREEFDQVISTFKFLP